MAIWSLNQSSFTGPDGATGITAHPFEAAYARMAPGDICDVAPGSYQRFTLKPARVPGSGPVTFRAPPLVDGKCAVTIARDTHVGGTSAAVLYPGAGDVRFSRMRFEVDDRAGFFTEKGQPGKTSGVYNVFFNLCEISGNLDAYTANSQDNSTWGVRCYETGGWTFDSCKFQNIGHEHGFYGDGISGNHTFKGCTFKHTFRTGIQIVNRPPPDGAMTVPGFGDVMIDGCTFVDTCLEQSGGGSAIHLAGGMPAARVTIKNVIGLFGCDENLAAPFNKNITGLLACKDGPPTYPGGLGELHLVDVTSEVGTVYPGVAGARRANVAIDNVGLLTFEKCSFKQAKSSSKGGAPSQVALQIGSNVGQTVFVGTPADFDIQGQVIYRNAVFKDFPSFAAANPALFQ